MSISAVSTQLLPIRSISLSVCVFVRKVYCGTMANWIWMPFGVVSGVSGGMVVLDGGSTCPKAKGGYCFSFPLV